MFALEVAVLSFFVHTVTESRECLVCGLRECSELVILKCEIFCGLIIGLDLGNEILPCRLCSFYFIRFGNLPISVHSSRRKHSKKFYNAMF